MIPEKLILRLADADPQIRIEAIDELSRLEEPDALACLVESLKDAEPAVRSAARDGLKRMTGIDLGDERDAWLDWWKKKAGIRCMRCGRRLFNSPLYYLARVQFTSEPKELYLSEEDLRPRLASELRKAAEELAGRDPGELRDEVYVRLRYYLCAPCKTEFVRTARDNGAGED